MHSLLDKSFFYGETVLLTRRHATPVFTLFFSLTHITYVTQWSSGTAPVLLTGRYAAPVITW